MKKSILLFIFLILLFVPLTLGGGEIKTCSCSGKGCSCTVEFENFVGPGCSLADASIEVSVKGDFGSKYEYSLIYADDSYIGTVCKSGCKDNCKYWMGARTWDVTSYAADNRLVVKCDATSYVNYAPSNCGGAYQICRVILNWTEECPKLEWRNQGQEMDLVFPDEWANLYAQLRDAHGLDWAWLSTNESGSWVNYTDGNCRLPCPEGHADYNEGGCEASFKSTFDGSVRKEVGEKSQCAEPNYELVETERLRFGDVCVYKRLGACKCEHRYQAFVEWDVTSIPRNADISGAKFLYHGLDDETPPTEKSYIEGLTFIRPSDVDPNNETEVIYLYWNGPGPGYGGKIYHESTTFPEKGKNREILLDEDAVTDLNNQLVKGWFAFSMDTYYAEESRNEIAGRLYDGATPKPTLEVVYSLDNTCMRDLRGNYDWAWSNISWQNSSLSPGTIVSWRIYYNNTLGEANATDVKTVKIISKEMYDVATQWLEGWKYRRHLLIDNRKSYDELVNYSVKIVVNTSSLIKDGKLKENCADLRFTDPDGSTKLEYFIDPNECNKTNSTIWVKVPKIPARDLQPIYMYYGNPEASSESDPYKTFFFFEDFEDGNLDGWSYKGWEVREWKYTIHPWYNYSAWRGDIPGEGEYCIYRTFDLQSASRISFWWRIDSDKGRPCLRFYIPILKRSLCVSNGKMRVEFVEVGIKSGWRQIKWCYEEDKKEKGDGYFDYVAIRPITHPEPQIIEGNETEACPIDACIDADDDGFYDDLLDYPVVPPCKSTIHYNECPYGKLTVEPNPAGIGETVNITVEAWDEDGVEGITVFFKGEHKFCWRSAWPPCQVKETKYLKHTWSTSYDATGTDEIYGWVSGEILGGAGMSYTTPPNVTLSVFIAGATLSITKGWNLISIPAEKIAAVEDPCGVFSNLYYYDVDLDPPTFRKVGWRELEGGKGYWLYSPKSCVVELSYVGLVESLPKLKAGWNLIGTTSFAPYTVDEIKGDCVIIDSPHYWDDENQKWVETDTFEAGKGYWIKVESDCNFS